MTTIDKLVTKSNKLAKKKWQDSEKKSKKNLWKKTQTSAKKVTE